MLNESDAGLGNNTIVIDKSGVIVVVTQGLQSSESTRELAKQLSETIASRRAQKKKIFILFDLRSQKAHDTTSDARVEGRRLFASIHADAIAVVGNSQILLLVSYLVRLAKPAMKIRFFKNLSQAKQWLGSSQRLKHKHSSSAIIIGIILCAIGVSALLGWQLSNPYLKSLVPSLRPMNPLAALGLLFVGIGFIGYARNQLRMLRFAGLVCLALGIGAILPLHINYLLYGDKLTPYGSRAHIALSAAISFICLGVIALLAKRNKPWVRPLTYAAAVLVGLLALFTIFGQLYATAFIYSISGTFFMALNLAIAFAIAAVGLIVLALYRQFGNIFEEVSVLGWFAVLAIIFVQVAIYGAWSQAISRNTAEANRAFAVQASGVATTMTNRLNAYLDALQGFGGFYASSNYVSQDEFQTYYESLNLPANYPGLRSMAFVAAVKTNDLPAFVQLRRQDASLNPGGNPTFRIINQTTAPVHYIATYTTDLSNQTNLGLDITSIPGRTTIYDQAITSKRNYTSGPLVFTASKNQPAQRGFFIAVPVKSEDSTSYAGVVIASFNYGDLFAAFFADKSLDDAFNIHVDDVTGGTVYAANNAGNVSEPLNDAFTIPIANGGWHLHITAAKNFGISQSQLHIPASILFFGQVFTIALIWIFASQLRARNQAMQLVDSVTADLQHERDTIEKLRIKDEAILGSLGEGLIALDKAGNVERLNRAGEVFLGRDEGEVAGKHFSVAWEALDSEGRPMPRAKRPLEKALTKKKPVIAQLFYLRKDGERFPVAVNVAPITVEDEVIGAIEVFRDITKEKQLERLKDEFLSVASHELRTPMGAVRALVTMILDGDYGPVNKNLIEPLADIKSSTVRLVELVNDLLGVVRIEAGRMQFTLSDFNISAVAKEVAESLAPLAKEKGLDLTCKASVAVSVEADIDKVKQVLTNLIGNALKFTDKGSITVSVQAVGDKAEITVSDTGMGISSEDQAKLFKKFQQINSVQQGKPTGTGLGLYISREMIRRMGGSLGIQNSSIGKGSTFSFTLVRSRTTTALRVKRNIDHDIELTDQDNRVQ